MDKEERNHTIDVLKGICIIFVIITHCNFSDSQRLLALFPFWIYMAVPIFLFLSGYLWSLSYKKQKIYDLKSCYNIKKITKKVFRFILPFFIVFLIEEIILIIYSKSFSIKSFLLDFICGGLGPGGYYTPIMIQLIILFPLIYVYISRNNRFSSLIYFLMLNIIYEFIVNIFSLKESYYRLLIFRYIFIIAAGCYISLQKVRIKKKYYIISFLLGITYIIIVEYFKYDVFIKYWRSTSVFTNLYIIPIVVYILNNIKINCKILEKLSKASYHIFLTQMLYYYKLSKYVYEFIGNDLVVIFISIIICSFCGYLFYKLEKILREKILKEKSICIK